MMGAECWPHLLLLLRRLRVAEDGLGPGPASHLGHHLFRPPHTDQQLGAQPLQLLAQSGHGLNEEARPPGPGAGTGARRRCLGELASVEHVQGHQGRMVLGCLGDRLVVVNAQVRAAEPNHSGPLAAGGPRVRRATLAKQRGARCLPPIASSSRAAGDSHPQAAREAGSGMAAGCRTTAPTERGGRARALLPGARC